MENRRHADCTDRYGNMGIETVLISWHFGDPICKRPSARKGVNSVARGSSLQLCHSRSSDLPAYVMVCFFIGLK